MMMKMINERNLMVIMMNKMLIGDDDEYGYNDEDDECDDI